MNFTWKYAQKKFARISWIFDPKLTNSSSEVAARSLVDHLENFLQTIGLRKTLKELGVPKEELDLLAERSLVLPDYKSHPYVVNFGEVRQLLQEAYE
jgi:alcohol dehydrogenase class IV